MSSRYLNLKIIAPDKLIADSQVEQVSLPSVDGYLGILPGHVALVAALGEGEITYVSQGKEEKIKVRNGWADINEDEVIIFTSLVLAEQSVSSQANEPE